MAASAKLSSTRYLGICRDASLPKQICDAGPDSRIAELAEKQPEFEWTTGQYVRRLISAERLAQGRIVHQEKRELLTAIESQFGVPAPVLMAIWGIESQFGTETGSFDVLRSLATLASLGDRRADFWRSELEDALRILAGSETGSERLLGSWAGAMGHMQFMPSTWLAHAVDFDGDGRRDICESVSDALASAANYLAVAGWQPELPWGVEVEASTSFDWAAPDVGAQRSWDAWIEAGLRTSSAFLPGNSKCRLLAVEGCQGPMFLVTASFDAVLAYNRSNAYGLAVCMLADHLSDQPVIKRPWLDASACLSRVEREAVQRHLASLGYETGGIDGIIGRSSREAIRAFQLSHGLTADGFASRALLDHMQGG